MRAPTIRFGMMAQDLSAKNQMQHAFTIWKNERPDLAKQLSILPRQFDKIR